MSTNERQTRRQELIASLRRSAADMLNLEPSPSLDMGVVAQSHNDMLCAADYLQGQEDAAQNILRRFEERRAEGGQ